MMIPDKDMLDSLKSGMGTILDIETQAAESIDLSFNRLTFEYEFISLGFYVAGVDNDISLDELELISYLFGYEAGPQEVKEIIGTLGDTYDLFINKLQLPGWEVCKAIDRSRGDKDVSDLYIMTCDALMKIFASIDGNADPQEEAFIDDFIRRLRADQ